MPGNDLRALVFDFDGTIAETERDGHRVAYDRAFAELGFAWRWDEATYGDLRAVAGGRERLEAFLQTVAPDMSASERERTVRAVHAAKRRHFAPLAGSLAIRPGIVRLVGEARAAGVRLAVATTAATDGVRAVLDRHADLADAFDAIVGGEDAPRKKPDPAAYRIALQRLGTPARAAIAIEDSAIGLQAARAAELVTLVAPSSYTTDDDFAGAAAVVSDLGEPDRPARTLAGRGPERGYADLAYLRTLR